jgi:hypothetical protein
MRSKTKFLILILTLVIAVLGLNAHQAKADTVLTFEGLQDGEAVLNYYNGGFGSLGSGPGPNDGITFSPNSVALISTADGGSGNFLNAPSGDTIVYFESGGADTMNVAAGFSGGFSFFYAAPDIGGIVTVWSGLNGTGTELASLALPVTGPGANCPTFACVFDTFGVTFSGVAESVNFGGTENQIGFDNITLGSSIPGVPEPGTLPMIVIGLAALVALGRKRFAAHARELPLGVA